MKKSSRILCVLLAALCCLTVAACATPSDNDTNETTPADGAADTTPAPSGGDNTTDPGEDVTPGFDLSTLDFGQKTATILYWDDVERPEFFVEGQTGDNVIDAIFERNVTVESMLDVKLEFIGEKGNVNNSSTYLKKVQNSFNAGEKVFDILASHSRTGGIVAAGGMAMDLMSIDDSYLDFEMPWWPSTMVDTATIGNKMYFVSGDISTNTLHFMYGVYYNADMITDLQLDDPTAIALNGKWTLDKMIAMTENLYQDLNDDGKKNLGDAFGMTTLYFHADSFYTGAGMSWIDKDSDGLPRVSPDYTSEKAINLAETLAAWFNTNVCYTENNDPNTSSIFSAGNSLFAQNRIFIADNAHSSGLNNAPFTYGVVPVPKYDESQDRYYTTVGNPFTLYEIMLDCEETDMATAVLEALGQQGYQLTTPAIFEVNMKYKYSATNETSQVFDIIRSSIVFDLGRIFGANLNKMSEIYSKACINNQSWASTSAGQGKLVVRSLNKLMESFD